MARETVSALLLDELFAAADERFVPALRQFHDPKKLATLADRWKRDHRPWARRKIFEYLDLGLNVAGHEPVVKRLFKHAEAHGDGDLMAAFAAAFDLLVRRVKKKRGSWDWQTRTAVEEEYLSSPRNRLYRSLSRDELSRMTRQERQQPSIGKAGTGEVLFSYHTRHYLQRRAWRYFRRKGHQKPDEYPVAVAAMLRLYTDGYLGSGLSMLDSWSLMNACFGESDVIEFRVPYPRVKGGRKLAELKAAPAFEHLWAKAESARLLVSLLMVARAHAVRVWAIQVLRKHHLQSDGRLSAEQVLQLFESTDPDVQAFAAEAIENVAGIEKLELSTWLKLLETPNLTALEILARLMQQHVTGERLSLDQLIDLCCARPVPVARVGFAYLNDRPIRTADERAAIARLAKTKCAGVAGELTTWALAILGTRENYDVDHVTAFFDSLHQTARDAAWTWLRPGAPGFNDPALWSRLIETPYDDVRFNVVRALEHRTKLPGAADDQVTHVWASVLLGIHRGGRTKLVALRQISDAVRRDPARAEPLLPVLAVAIRSVRLPEARHGLAAIVSAVEAHPPLREPVMRVIPELEIPAAEEVATA